MITWIKNLFKKEELKSDPFYSDGDSYLVYDFTPHKIMVSKLKVVRPDMNWLDLPRGTYQLVGTSEKDVRVVKAEL